MRFAIYFTPPQNDGLTQSGASWLGRDAFDEQERELVAQPLVQTPARYGFHATIKAPFELAAQTSPEELQEVFRLYCKTKAPFTLPALKVAYTGNSFILGIERESAELQNLAADIVRHFEPFRAPLSERDIARRKPEQLTGSQRRNLDQWGYSHVMEDFRFHITLTGPVAQEECTDVERRISAHFAPFLGKPLLFSGLGLFVEPARGENFHVKDWQAFTA